MSNRQTAPMTPELRERWQRAVRETEAELPDMLSHGERLREAAAEETLSGLLRRAIHHSHRRLESIATAAGIPIEDLNAFLSGDRTLRSDVLDRVALAVGFAQSLQAVGQAREPGDSPGARIDRD
jgi:hypothetical protein